MNDKYYNDAMAHTKGDQVFMCMGCDGDYMEEIYRNKKYVVYYTSRYGYSEVLDIEQYGEHPYGEEQR